jgi:hypothetical protein
MKWFESGQQIVTGWASLENLVTRTLEPVT